MALGRGGNPRTPLEVPLDLVNGAVPTKVLAGANHTVVLLSNGSIVAWGDNTWFQVNPFDLFYFKSFLKIYKNINLILPFYSSFPSNVSWDGIVRSPTLVVFLV